MPTTISAPTQPAPVITHQVNPSTQSGAAPITTTTSHVNLDPITGQPTAVKACCHKGGHSHLNISSSPSSTQNQLLTVLGVGLLTAGIGYGIYRYYQYLQDKKLTPSSSSVLSSNHDSYPVRTVHDEADFDRVLSAVTTLAASQHRSVYVLVEGSHDPLTDLSWCPDCQQADPIIHAVLSQYKQHIILIRAPVTRAHYKNNPSHPYRQHTQLLLQRIPTLYHFIQNKVIGQLIETELHDINKVQQFVQYQQALEKSI